MQIDKNIPAPKFYGRGRIPKYPFGEMEVGDSIFFDGKNTKSSPLIVSYQYGKRHGKKFMGRTIDGGLRIWRVE